MAGFSTLTQDSAGDHDFGAHSSDQATATDKPVGASPKSGTADPEATGTY